MNAGTVSALFAEGKEGASFWLAAVDEDAWALLSHRNFVLIE